MQSVTYSYTSFDVPPTTSSTAAFGINDKGEIVGEFLNGHVHGFVYSDGGYTTIDPPGTTATVAFGVSNQDQIVGTYYDSNGQAHGFLDLSGTFQFIDNPGANFGGTVVTGIDDKGTEIVGYYSSNTGESRFYLQPRSLHSD
jgi:probable HAF family extracellular repeat protein